MANLTPSYSESPSFCDRPVHPSEGVLMDAVKSVFGWDKGTKLRSICILRGVAVLVLACASLNALCAGRIRGLW